MTRIDTKRLSELVSAAKSVAIGYKHLTGRPLSITGEVAEYEAVRLLGLEIADARQSGFDARDADGTRFQIKGRCLGSHAKSGQIGGIRLDREWDAVLLVLLDEEFAPVSIYVASRPAVEAALAAPGSQARNKRGALSVSKFKSIGKLVWTRDPSVSKPDSNNAGGAAVRRLSDLPRLSAMIPKLSQIEANDFARDLEEARAALNNRPLEDRWAS